MLSVGNGHLFGIESVAKVPSRVVAQDAVCSVLRVTGNLVAPLAPSEFLEDIARVHEVRARPVDDVGLPRNSKPIVANGLSGSVRTYEWDAAPDVVTHSSATIIIVQCVRGVAREK